VSEHLSQRAYARARGVTHRAVQKQLQSGHIHLEPDGLIDRARADTEWTAETNPAKAVGAPGPGFAAAAAGLLGRPQAISEATPPAPPLARPLPNGAAKPGLGSSLEAFSQARTLNETYKARTTRLEFERLEGSLVRADDMRLSGFNAARRARDLLLALPDRLAAVLAGTSDPVEVHRLLTADIRRVCEELGRPLLVKGPDGKPRSL
jgi:hypothetical protein